MRPVVEEVEAAVYLERTGEAPMDHTAKRALLEQAVRLLGRTNVAARFGVPETLLGAWMRGETPMPTRNLLVLAAMLDQLAKATDGGLRPYDERRAP